MVPTIFLTGAGQVAGSTGVFSEVRWSPYVVGALIGVLGWIAVLVSGKTLGVSTAYARTAGMIEKGLRGRGVEQKAYWQKFEPKVDWEWMLVFGLFLGAFTSAVLSGGFRLEWIPPLWANAVSDSVFWRWVWAFVGGAVMGFGARWAGGCTSGHALSGTAQLAVSSWLAAICFFIGGIGAAMVIYHVVP